MGIVRSLRYWVFAAVALLFITTCQANPPSSLPSASQPANGRVVEQAMGATVVPQTPQRVVVLSQSALDNSIALGVKPIGSTYAGFPQRSGYGKYPSYLRDKAAGITNVGHAGSPNLEAILRLKPDLILGNQDDHRQLYPRLSQIAPTVLANNREQSLTLFATALNKSDVAEQLTQAFEQRIQTFQQKMGDRLKSTEVSVLRFRPDQVRLYMKQSFCGYILDQVGLPRPESQRKDKFYETVSVEAIPAMDGDVIFYFQDNPNDSAAQQIMNHPLWLQLNAVQQGRVYQVSLDTWFLGNGILAANAVLDDLFKHLVDDQGKKSAVEISR
jgi:iron complex transport system substrate-binding protein